jgi:hypothetical protein
MHTTIALSPHREISLSISLYLFSKLEIHIECRAWPIFVHGMFSDLQENITKILCGDALLLSTSLLYHHCRLHILPSRFSPAFDRDQGIFNEEPGFEQALLTPCMEIRS